MLNEIQRMLPRHYKILDLALAGANRIDIAQALDMSKEAVGMIMNAPIFQNEIARRRENINAHTDSQLASVPMKAKQLLEDNAVAAAQVHVDCLTEVDPKVRQASASEILDRVFGKDDGKKASNVVILEPGAIQLLALAMQESSNDRENTQGVGGEVRTQTSEEPGRTIQNAGTGTQEVETSRVFQNVGK